MKDFGFGTQIRKSPFFDATVKWGAKDFSVYNHMYIPRDFGDPEQNFWNLINDAILCDVAVERQVEVKGPDATKFVQMMTPRDLSNMKIGQCKYVILVNQNGGVLNDPVLILSGKNWHEGVIGIVAARLKDKFNKPVILISLDDNIGKASARSIVGFDIGSVIIAATQEKILLKGGGHKMAGGFTIDIENLNKFKDFIFNKYQKNNMNIDKEKILYLDSVISPTAINLEFYNKISLIGPFGSGNPEPKFLVQNLRLVNNTIVGEKHIKSILVGKDGTSFKSIAFNSTENDIGAYLLKKDNKLLDIVGKLSLNQWRGQSNVEFIIDDISVNKTIKNKVPSSIG